MANEIQRGLLADLGLELAPAQAAAMARQQRMAQVGGSPFADAYNVGQQLGRGMSPAAAALGGAAIGGIGGLITGKGATPGRGWGAFKANAQQGGQDMVVANDAAALGITPEQYQSRVKTQEAAAAIKPANTGDPIQDQIVALQEIVRIANRNGDSDTALKAMQKMMALKQQAQAYQTAELQNKGTKQELEEATETGAAARSIYLPGDDPEGQASLGYWDEEQQQWVVQRPDGTTINRPKGGVLLADRDKGLRERQFETPEAQLDHALKLNGYTSVGIRQAKEGYATFADTAEIVDSMIGNMLNMYNPSLALSDTQEAATFADRALTFVDNVASVFTSDSEKKADEYRLKYNGKAVSQTKQRDEATRADHLTKFLSDQGLSLNDILPKHIRADTAEAQLFVANLMQLAYLDARLQEPANRGLSDSDIQNALKRIGAGSPNPAVFALRWRENLARLQQKSSRLGEDLAGVGDVTTFKMIDHLWPERMRDRVDRTLMTAQDSITKFMQDGFSQGIVSLEGLSNEQLQDLLNSLPPE